MTFRRADGQHKVLIFRGEYLHNVTALLVGGVALLTVEHPNFAKQKHTELNGYKLLQPQAARSSSGSTARRTPSARITRITVSKRGAAPPRSAR